MRLEKPLKLWIEKKKPYLYEFFFHFRHNLTLNKAFIKVPRPATEGRGAYWKLEAGAEAQIFRRMARNYNRPKPVSFARQNIYYCDTTDINTVFITVPTWCMCTIWGLGAPRAPLGSVVGPPETLPPIQSVQQSFIFVLVFWRISSKNKDNKKKNSIFILVQILLPWISNTIIKRWNLYDWVIRK